MENQTKKDILIHSITGDVMETGEVWKTDEENVFGFKNQDESNTVHNFIGYETKEPNVYIWQNWV